MPCGFESRPRYMNLRSRVRELKKRIVKRDPLVTVGISQSALLHNLNAYRALYPKHQIAPVLKSNAYGHGLAVVAEILDNEPIAFFMVDSLYEARKLRHAGIRSRIVVMGYVRPRDIARNRLPRIDFAVLDIEQLRELASLASTHVRIHLKIDTGMHRQGLMPTEIPEAVDLIRSHAHIEVVGVATHLGDADTPDSVMTQLQLERWNQALSEVEEAFPLLEYRHVAATKGARYAAEANTNVIRAGMGLYDYDSSFSEAALVPVLELRSSVAMLRTVPQGEAVGYNATHRTARETRLATIPLGYYEGIDRRLSNQGVFLIQDMPAPITGRVSMNMSSVDVTDIPGVKRGDVVVAISRDPSAPNSVREIAKIADTTPYVILAHIPEHLRRVVE